jgi:sarcosine oxidase
MSTSYDVIVVGAGGAGSAAAYHLAHEGRRTLLLEQFAVGHVRGSSHGESRIIRHSYAEKDYVTLAPPAFAAWRQLEAESGLELLALTGGVDLGPPEHPQFAGRISALGEAGIPFEVLEGQVIAGALPQFRVPAGWAALYQPDAGILNASRCVRTMAERAVVHGAELREHAPVLEVKPDGAGVAVRFAGPEGEETAYADRAIITAGPWAGRFFAQLGLPAPMIVRHQQVVYYPVERPELYTTERCPVYIVFGENGFYGFPIWERPGFLKVATELDGPAIDPDTPPLPPDEAALDQLNQIVATTLVGVRPEPAEVVTCRYTVSPSGDFIMDRHPEHPQIVLGSPCSGHGFKFTIVSGRLLADLATSAAGHYGSPLWRERFRIG